MMIPPKREVGIRYPVEDVGLKSRELQGIMVMWPSGQFNAWLLLGGIRAMSVPWGGVRTAHMTREEAGLKESNIPPISRVPELHRRHVAPY